MSKDLSNYRKSYLLGELIESALPEDPLELFSDWFSNVEKIGKEIVTLPMHPNLKQNQIDKIILCTNKFAR